MASSLMLEGSSSPREPAFDPNQLQFPPTDSLQTYHTTPQSMGNGTAASNEAQRHGIGDAKGHHRGDKDTRASQRVQNAVDRNQSNRFLWEIAFKRRILASITDYLHADDVHHLFTSSRILQNGSIEVEGLLRRSLWKHGFTPKNRLKFWMWSLTPSPVIERPHGASTSSTHSQLAPLGNSVSSVKETSNSRVPGMNQWSSEGVRVWGQGIKYTKYILSRWDWAGVRPISRQRRAHEQRYEQDEEASTARWPVFSIPYLRKKSGIFGEIFRDSVRTIPECSLFSEESLESLRPVLGNQAGSGNFNAIYLPGLPALWASLVIFHTILCPDVGYCQGMNHLTAMLLVAVRRGRIARDRRRKVTYVPQDCFHISDIVAVCCILKALAEQHGAKECWAQHLPRLCSFGYMITKLFRHQFPEHFASSLAKSNFSSEMLAAVWLLPLMSNYLPIAEWERLIDCFCAESWLAIFKVLAAVLHNVWERMCSTDPAEISDFLKWWRETSTQITLADVTSTHVRRFVSRDETQVFKVLLDKNLLMQQAYKTNLTFSMLQKWEHDNAISIISARISKMYSEHSASETNTSDQHAENADQTAMLAHCSVDYQNRTLNELPIVPPIPKPLTHLSSWHYWPRSKQHAVVPSKPVPLGSSRGGPANGSNYPSKRSLYSKLHNSRLYCGGQFHEVTRASRNPKSEFHSPEVASEHGQVGKVNISNETRINDALRSLCKELQSMESPVHNDVSSMMKKIDAAVKKLHESSSTLKFVMESKKKSEENLWNLLQEKRELKEKLRTSSMGEGNVDMETARNRVRDVGAEISALDTKIHEASSQWKADMWRYTLAETEQTEAAEAVNALRQQLVSLLLQTHNHQRHKIVETWKRLVAASS
eukprot:gb/GECG01013329.1/.p1 GENE.gb/GECG01013329.1/~~gb/GECG01013329.1/.p1  ORF type:complete len:879 (+),score=91.51 gb/GECG01013329.1/:1-2637(+)